MTSDALQRALTVDGSVLPLPSVAAELLTALDAPPRLAAHLRAVHHVAVPLTARLADEGIAVDGDAVHFGAATHDIGKVQHVEELEQPGHRHEEAGWKLLLQYGVPAELARFAGTHGSWDGEDRTLEDLAVSLADTVWKGHRVTGLEQRALTHVVEQSGLEEWDAFLRLDGILADLAADADRLLAFQFSHPVRF